MSFNCIIVPIISVTITESAVVVCVLQTFITIDPWTFLSFTSLKCPVVFASATKTRVVFYLDVYLQKSEDFLNAWVSFREIHTETNFLLSFKLFLLLIDDALQELKKSFSLL